MISIFILFHCVAYVIQSLFLSVLDYVGKIKVARVYKC